MIFRGLLLLSLLVLIQFSLVEPFKKANDLVPELIEGDVEMSLARQNISHRRGMTKRQNDGCSASTNGPPAGLPSVFPRATASRSCSKPIRVTGTFDGGMRRYDRGTGFRGANNCLNIEPGNADTIFLLENGATLQNVIIGQNVKDAVYCLGSCSLKNVYFELTCEDSLSLKNPTSCSSCVMSWTGGAINGFRDKAVQHNGGGTTKLTNIDVFYSGSGKFYRSCGGCGYPPRHVELRNIRVHGSKGEALVGINDGKGDTARLTDISIPNSFGKNWAICKKFTSKTSGADAKSCLYSPSTINWT